MSWDAKCRVSYVLWAVGFIGVIAMFVDVNVPSSISTRELLRRNLLSLNDVEDYVIKAVNPSNIRTFLRNLTLNLHLGGTEDEWNTAQWVADTWKLQGMDEVHMVPYKVLLSYPSASKPNQVRLLDGLGHQMWVAATKQKPLYAPEESIPDIPFNFNGYGAAGNVRGSLVYAHYGSEKDFAFLANAGVNVSGTIVLARYGQSFRANIAQRAEEQGALGLLLFSDPADYAPVGPDFVYPHSYFMPPSAAPLGTTKLVDGDPLTPFYPATESAFRIPEEEASIPKIPVQPISYSDAFDLLSEMSGAAAPETWQGDLNMTYRLGPGFREADWTVNLEVNNQNIMTTTYNVIGVLQGREEPDRYVMLGNHLDAWLLGAVDPSSGTAAMLELSRVFLQLHNETGWRPRRSLVFCGWGAEEYGLVGSVEWTEQFAKQLSDRAVAYLNVDMAIEGNYTLRTKSVPILTEAVYESAKRIPNPNPEEVEAGRTTVYDTWAHRRPDPVQPNLPLMQLVGTGSDYKGLQHNIGVPCMDTRYTHDNNTLGDPLYHTVYETFALVDEIYDRGFKYHSAVTALWGDLAIKLAESKILPFSLHIYADYISKSQKNIQETYGQMISSQNISLEFFADAVVNFNKAVTLFDKVLNGLDQNNPLAVRQVNDQLMLVERSFIDPQGLPGRSDYNHVITAPSKNNAYGGTAFAGLVDTLTEIEEASENDKKSLWRTFAQHLAAVTHFINTAAKVLSDDLW
ncbi:putative N-acetylated-alpha-linked acidic dipeptidase isoform X2 [Portunus trituberculatus]|uniref:putative N-acetylated-alpha-linked acidic dipeptidase isoform X2 n=1 Tax=Portunus trituberculatus TaxID=210409 RepID=UPI001E1D13FD|nr:putative N-acetylated-alpha-linked acidic dipeptidase isoform X2 [Portunus trituberculatus]